MKEIKITVCVPTYDRHIDLENLIKSYLSLQYQNSSLLILDDLGSPRIAEVALKYSKKDKRIIYHKNQHNLGFTENMRQGIALAPEGVIIFMGDDDIFIDENALSYFAEVFADAKIGVAKCAQVFYQNGLLNQASNILNNSEDSTVYRAAKEAMNHVWLETSCITGTAFRVDKKIKNLVSHSATFYPQIELAFAIGLFYRSARINKYLVGYQSYSSNQLNSTFYKLEEETNILRDWVKMYEKIQELANTHTVSVLPKKVFIREITSVLPTLYPYTRLTLGKSKTMQIIQECLAHNPYILLKPRVVILMLISLLLPKKALVFFLTAYKKQKLHHTLTKNQREYFNEILAKYY